MVSGFSVQHSVMLAYNNHTPQRNELNVFFIFSRFLHKSRFKKAYNSHIVKYNMNNWSYQTSLPFLITVSVLQINLHHSCTAAQWKTFRLTFTMMTGLTANKQINRFVWITPVLIEHEVTWFDWLEHHDDDVMVHGSDSACNRKPHRLAWVLVIFIDCNLRRLFPRAADGC